MAAVVLLRVQLMSLGMIGEYLGRTFDESKGRPLHLVDSLERSSLAGRAAGLGAPDRTRPPGAS